MAAGRTLSRGGEWHNRQGPSTAPAKQWMSCDVGVASTAQNWHAPQRAEHQAVLQGVHSLKIGKQQAKNIHRVTMARHRLQVCCTHFVQKLGAPSL
jgi:hypothetical protein